MTAGNGLDDRVHSQKNRVPPKIKLEVAVMSKEIPSKNRKSNTPKIRRLVRAILWAIKIVAWLWDWLENSLP